MSVFLYNLKQLIIAIDQLLYNIFGVFHAGITLLLYPFKKKIEKYWDFNFKTSADDTICAVCWRKRKDNPFWYILRILIDGVLFFDKNHCEESYNNEVLGKHHILK